MSSGVQFNSNIATFCFNSKLADVVELGRQSVSSLYIRATEIVADESVPHAATVALGTATITLGVVGLVFAGSAFLSATSDVAAARKKEITSSGRVFVHSFVSKLVSQAVTIAGLVSLVAFAPDILSPMSKHSSDGFTCYEWRWMEAELENVTSIFLSYIPLVIGVLFLAGTPVRRTVGDLCAKTLTSLVGLDLPLADIARLRGGNWIFKVLDWMRM